MTRVERLLRTGILRVAAPDGGFAWRRADGRPLADRDRRRAEALVLPPAWTDVAVSASPRADLQAVGRDAAGRVQYVYHEGHERRRERRKLERMIRFAAALPKLRRRVTADLRRPGLSRDRVAAAVVRILDTAFLRPGSRAYAEEHGSHGVTTLRRRHVRVVGRCVALDFVGKAGKRHVREIHDAALARVVRECLRAPGRHVFEFESEGRRVAVRRRTVNAYVREATGGAFTAKDFRTWAGTVVCASAMAHVSADCKLRRRRERTRAAVAAVKATAEQLGNTPAVCRASYVSPALLTEFERSSTLGERLRGGGAFDGRGRRAAEREVLRLLRSLSRPAARPGRSRRPTPAPVETAPVPAS